MHPTPTEELAGINRLVTSLAEHPDLPPDLIEELVTVGRILRRLERSTPLIPAWVAADSAANAALLHQLRSQLPAGLAAEVDRAAAAPHPSDPEAAEASNGRLRDLLARAVVASTAGRHGEEVRRRIASRLAESLDDRPW